MPEEKISLEEWILLERVPPAHARAALAARGWDESEPRAAEEFRAALDDFLNRRL